MQRGIFGAVKTILVGGKLTIFDALCGHIVEFGNGYEFHTVSRCLFAFARWRLCEQGYTIDLYGAP